jgi:hypothetical protein
LRVHAVIAVEYASRPGMGIVLSGASVTSEVASNDDVPVSGTAVVETDAATVDTTAVGDCAGLGAQAVIPTITTKAVTETTTTPTTTPALLNTAPPSLRLGIWMPPFVETSERRDTTSWSATPAYAVCGGSQYAS